MGYRKHLGGVWALAMFWPMVVLGQVALPVFELERLELNPGAEGSLVVGMGELLPAGDYRVSLVASYAHRPLLLARGPEEWEVVGARVTTHLAGAYAVASWLQVGVQVPLIASQQGADLRAEGLTSPASSGLGTPMIGIAVGLWRQGEQGGLDVAMGGGLGLPLGSETVLAREQGLRYTPRLMVGRRFGVVRASVEAGVLLRPGVRLNPQRVDATEGMGNELRLGAALATTGRRLRWEFNVRGMVSLEGQPGAVELLPGARYLVNPSLELFALAGAGLGAAPGTPAFRVLVGGSFGDVTPPRGPGESSVNCEPALPHTVEECPDMDEDQDGTPNAVDRCPLETGTPERNGCPRQDADGDGVEDMLDGCPKQPGLASLRGCPVQDEDKDELPDDQDSCPAEPGPPENRGCPVKDLDGDGIENDQDACPAEPGLAERQGCPEEDSDKDGVPNRADSCVSAPGLEQNFGCPQHEIPGVVLTPRQLELKGKVYFEVAQARIQRRSYPLLDWVARVLNEHPEIPLVVVGAHTDDRGFADDNRRLSQQRAQAVRDYLIEMGVSPARLQAKGYGPDRPIDSNATSIGRENNRRVDFFIVRHQDESTQTP